jgi:purine-binding chemotaxis protein CheW
MRSILIFNAGSEEFGLPIEIILEVRKTSEMVKVPQAPEFIEGVSHIRGRPVAIIDLAKRLGKEETKLTPQCRFLVTSLRNVVVGLLVDSAREVIEVEEKVLKSVQEAGLPAATAYVTEIMDLNGRLIPILKPDDLLSEAESVNLGKEGAVNG